MNNKAHLFSSFTISPTFSYIYSVMKGFNDFVPMMIQKSYYPSPSPWGKGLIREELVKACSLKLEHTFFHLARGCLVQGAIWCNCVKRLIQRISSLYIKVNILKTYSLPSRTLHNRAARLPPRV